MLGCGLLGPDFALRLAKSPDFASLRLLVRRDRNRSREGVANICGNVLVARTFFSPGILARFPS